MTEPRYLSTLTHLLDSDTMSCPECDTTPAGTGGNGAEKTPPLAVSTSALEVTVDVEANVPPVSAPSHVVATNTPQNIQVDTPAASSPVLPVAHSPQQGVIDSETRWYVVERGLKVGIFLGWYVEKFRS